LSNDLRPSHHSSSFREIGWPRSSPIHCA